MGASLPCDGGMLRVYSAEWDGSEALPELSAEERHHLVKVRRVRPGEAIEVLNGRGAVASATVAAVSGKSLEMALTAVKTVPPPALRIHLLVALPKGKTFPSLLHRAVELGVGEITPLLTENVAADAARAEKKGDRWEAVLVEALKQSGNPWLPRLHAPVELEAALANGPSDGARLCGALQAGARPLWEVLRQELTPRGTLSLFVGPEGDFSGEEYELLRASGCRFVTLGPLVLKVETAASLMAGTIRLWSLGEENAG